MVEIVESMYDRPWINLRVVRHPDPALSVEWLAIWNPETNEYKLDKYKPKKVKGYLEKLSLSLAGYDMSDDAAYFREMPHQFHKSRPYGPYGE